MFSGRWRVISAQTDGENRCVAPEGKDARSDQDEFYSWREKMMYSYIWVLFCSSVSGRYSAGNSPDLTSPMAHFIYFTKVKNTSLKLRCGQTASFLALCLLYTSCRHYELFWFWPDNRAWGDKDAKWKKKIKCQQSLVLIKHPVPTDSTLDAGAARELAVIKNEQN